MPGERERERRKEINTDTHTKEKSKTRRETLINRAQIDFEPVLFLYMQTKLANRMITRNLCS